MVVIRRPATASPFTYFHGTIHGTEKCLPLPGFCSLLFFASAICNGSGVQIRINSHLLTGHCIQGKSCGYFRHSLGTFIDYHELDQYQNNKDDNADDQVSAAYKFTESLHDITGITVPQDQSGGGGVQCYSEKLL